jgi:hypothetical protein
MEVIRMAFKIVTITSQFAPFCGDDIEVPYFGAVLRVPGDTACIFTTMDGRVFTARDGVASEFRADNLINLDSDASSFVQIAKVKYTGDPIESSITLPIGKPAIPATIAVLTKSSKRRIALRHYLQGAKFYKALRAMSYAEGFHQGLRKDNITPEFQHQIDIALYLITLKDIPDEERAIIGALLHDVREDYEVSYSDICSEYGADIADDNHLVTKTPGYNNSDYYTGMYSRPFSMLIKGADRINNLQGMVGIFTLPKIIAYCDEVDDFFHPMLKYGQNRYPEFAGAYTNIRTILTTQTTLMRHFVSSHKDNNG